MNLFDGIKNIFSQKQSQQADGIKPTGYEAYSAAVPDQWSFPIKKEFLEEMKGWVGAAVSVIADEIGSINIRLYEYKKDGVEEVQEHEILDLLYKVNEFTSKFDHFWLSQSYLELTGESPWFLERDNGKIKNIYFLRPDKIRPITGEDHLIKGYKYQISHGKEIVLDLDEVIFIKYPNPARPFRGLGTLQMAGRTVDIDNQAEEWNKNFFMNSARPDSVLNVKAERLNDQQKDELKKSIKTQYEGTKNAHKVMVLFGDMDFKAAGFSHRDMDFNLQSKLTRDKILGIFRVPKPIVSQTEDVNLASAKTAQYIFAKWTIKPKMERMIQQLNEFLLPMFKGTENMFLDYDSPVPEDQEQLIKKYDSGLTKGWLTINEVRTEQGLPEIDGGDVIYLPQNLAPVGELEGGEKKTSLSYKNPKQKRIHSADRINEVKMRGKRKREIKEIEEKTKEDIKKALKKEIKTSGQKQVKKKAKNQMS